MYDKFFTYLLQGYPNEPDDSDIPALSFLDCNEKCPEKCVSNEKWKYYNYESFNFIVDPTLELGCGECSIKFEVYNFVHQQYL